jgi:hypothetical protein
MLPRDLLADYSTNVDIKLFNSIVSEFREENIVKVNSSEGTYAVRLRADAYANVLGRILTAVDADTFDVDWQTKRIMTDARKRGFEDVVACQNQWMLLTVESKGDDIPNRASAETPDLSTQIAGRDINHFYGSVHGNGIENSTSDARENWWARWGTIFGGIGVAVAVLAIAASWYFWRYPSP